MIQEFHYTGNTGNVQEQAWFDLDGSGAINVEDITKLLDVTLMLWPGDADADGIFSTLDVVQVFVVGEYEDGIPDNSTWSEGDWDTDFDHDFNSLDIVAAWVENGLETGYRDGMLPVWGDNFVYTNSLLVYLYRFLGEETVNEVYFPYWD